MAVEDELDAAAAVLPLAVAAVLAPEVVAACVSTEEPERGRKG